MESRQGRVSWNKVYFSHAPSEILRLGLINKKRLEVVFKANLLFFDSLVIHSTALLGNPVLFKMSQDLKAQGLMSELYGKQPQSDSGAICPIFMDQTKNLSEVAKAMRKSKTIHGLANDDQLSEHAEDIDKFVPGFIHRDNKKFRKRFRDNMLTITGRILTDKTFSEEYGFSMVFPEDSLSKFAKWLNLADKGPELYLSQLIESLNHIYDRERDASLIREIEKLSFAIWHHSIFLSQEKIALTALRDFAIPIQCMRLISEQNVRDSKGSDFRKDIDSPEDIQVSLPIREMCDLDIAHLAQIRNLSSFKELRDQLAIFRELDVPYQGKRIKSNLVGKLETCADELRSYLVGLTNEPLRDRLLEQIERRKSCKKLNIIRILYSLGSPFALAVLLSKYPDYQPMTTLAMFTARAILEALSHIKQNNLDNNILPATHLSRDEFVIGPVNGRVSFPEDQEEV